VVLRALNGYGDPRPWQPQASTLWTVMAFLNTEKYPPSLLFLLMTLGPALLALAWAAQLGPRLGAFGRVLAVYGRVPLFYYVFHLLLIHGLAVLLVRGPGYGLPVVYAVWLGVVAALYLPCRWFAALKQQRPAWFWRYL
jgi:uncharacterized membrane protein